MIATAACAWIALEIAGVLVALWAYATACEGYEDRTGFHKKIQ